MKKVGYRAYLAGTKKKSSKARKEIPASTGGGYRKPRRGDNDLGKVS